MRRIRYVTVLTLLAVVVPAAVPAAAAPAWDHLQLLYDGEFLSPTVVADGSGKGTHGLVRSGGGGAVTAETEAGDAYFRFPGGSCTIPPCPQAIIQPSSAVNLVPAENGTGRFAFGADIRLTEPPSPAAGMNVFQYGAAAVGFSQWKLQVDYGRPSCRWSDGTTAVLLPAGPDGYQLRLGKWYRISCIRLSSVLFQIRVHDARTGHLVVPPAHATAKVGAILPTGSVVIGGKRVRADQGDVDTDQFHGDLDTIVFARREPIG